MAALAARGGRHSRLKHVVSFHGAKAGCVVSWVKEETTAELLLHQFTQQQSLQSKNQCLTSQKNAPRLVAEDNLTSRIKQVD
jgi:predicted DNA-binding WGR domain protein